MPGIVPSASSLIEGPLDATLILQTLHCLYLCSHVMGPAACRQGRAEVLGLTSSRSNPQPVTKELPLKHLSFLAPGKG